MLKTGWCVTALVALVFVSLVAGCGSGSPSGLTLQSISFETQAVPGGGAGQLYNVVLLFTTEGGAELPEQFALSSGVLPPGVRLVPDREDANADGVPDPEGALTGHARLIGFPREVGSFTFNVKGISTGGSTNPDQPDLSAEQSFTITVIEGTINVLTPTPEEGTTDPAVPAFDEVIPFVNPANPDAFYSFAFLVAGGSGNNINNIYLPRELELSTFDVALDNGDELTTDTNETVFGATNDLFENDFSDGGWFVLQAGNGKVQVGGFQSPRGPVGTIVGLRSEWFQSDAAPKNSRRNLQDSQGLAAGDTTLGTPLPLIFTDYFSAAYKDTHPESTDRAKYPFTADQYQNAFFVPFDENVDVTPLKFRIIVEVIDTRGTQDKSDDQIARVAYIVQVQIPNINIDTVALPAGQVGVDYTHLLAASGGVPPLSYELEYVDAISGNGKADENLAGQLDKAAFGLEMNTTTGQFFGAPRADGTVDITVRVFAGVMNPTQNGAVAVPTGGFGELDGAHPITGKKGRHKTIAIDFAAPNPLVVVNTSLSPGVDGFNYSGDPVAGDGGAPQLVPEPVGFLAAPYPSDAKRNYTITASYKKDSSHGAEEGTSAPGLPNALVIDGLATSPTNGVISGIAYDRGFHPVSIIMTDFYLGPATAPLVANATTVVRVIALSISPDSALYMRGAPGPTGNPSGLLDTATQIGEIRMVPMIMAASVYTVETGGTPARFSGIPHQADLLPVMIPNGGSDLHNTKSIPSVGGYFPAESNTETYWYYFGTRAWIHVQQQMTYLQVPNAATRIFVWGETETKRWRSVTSGGDSKRYQQYDPDGERGILIVNPLTGDFWTVCSLSNDVSSANDEGSQFGAEVVMQMRNGGSSSSTTGGYYGNDHNGYWKYYYNGPTPSRHDRELLSVGLGSYIEANSNTSGNNWYRTTQGRSAISIAVSADGLWCATALPGGTNEQKILLWRTDKQPIPDAIIAQTFVTGVAGTDGDGTVLPNMSAIFYLGGESFDQDGGGSFVNPTEMRRLNADSLMFVDDGLIFTQISNMDRIFGISLLDGHLSTRRINVGQDGVGDGDTRSFGSLLDDRGMYVPDQDYLKGGSAQQSFSVQFAFTGNDPAEGATGPNKIAFVAGETQTLTYFSNDTDSPIDGKHQRGNRNMSLMFLEVAKDGSGLRLDLSVMKDLTGDSSLIYGDLLTPGRAGEEQDWVKVSPNGDYAAVVRDRTTFDERFSSFSYYVPTFATPSSSTSWSASDDVMIISTTGDDLDSGKAGDQHVLFLGTRALSTNGSSASVPSYAGSRNIINGRYKRVSHLQFSQDNETLFFVYASDSTYPTKYYGSTSSWAINPEAATSSTFSFGTSMIVQVDFRTSTGGTINFTSGSISSIASNALQGLSGPSGIGPTTPPFNDTHSSVNQQFWAMFRSANGSFLYFISDQMSGRTYMVGFNMTNAEINGRKTFEPFSPHAATVGFAQIDANSFGYENRTSAVPAGTVYEPSGRDGDGIVLFIGSDSSAGATSATDLEVYAFDANSGGNLVALSADVTDGSANAINYLTMSTDGNFVIFHRSKTTGNSRDNRSFLTATSDLCCVNNVHAVLFSGGTPNAFYVSEDMSHGASVAFVGEGTSTGAQAVIFSSGTKGGNTTWDERTLKIALLGAGAVPVTLDSTQSFYEVLAGGRKIADDFTTGN